MSAFEVLLVCHGNTCRSPMGEALLRKLAAGKVGSIHASSAGLRTHDGRPPAGNAAAVMKERNIDISQHRTRQISKNMVDSADLILTMDSFQRNFLVRNCPDAADKIHLLRKDGRDIADPVGREIDVYRDTATEIEENLKPWVDATKQEL